MTRVLIAALSLLAPMAAMAADDHKISQLEQDIRDLQRLVQAQAQQINELRSQLLRPTAQPRAPSSPPAAVSSTWIDASKWQRLKAGMSELEVIGLLGPPTTLRGKESEQVLVYALEIGPSQFLIGKVTLRDRTVLAVQTPVLQ